MTTKMTQGRVEHLPFPIFQIIKCEFRQPIPYKFRPIIKVRTTRSGYEANVYDLLDRQRILGIAPVSAYENSQFVRERGAP